MKLVLHIDRLVLRGVPPAQREAVVASLRNTLQTELARPGVAARLAAQSDREALSARIAPQDQAQSIGRAAALGITRRLTA